MLNLEIFLQNLCMDLYKEKVSFFFRFCTECKRKVLKAFGILTGDIEADKVKG